MNLSFSLDRVIVSLDRIIAGLFGGVLMPMFGYFYGTDSIVITAMVTLIFFIVLDWLSGIRASKKDNTYGSRYGVDGVFRTFFIVLLPAGGHLLDVMIGLPGMLFGLFVGGLIYHTLQSMIANCIRVGWADWLPISALELATNWVQSELEAKMTRAQQRTDERNVKVKGR